MKFRAIPPDPHEFPRVKLVWPPVVPVIVLLIAWLTELAGHHWNIHGDLAAVILLFTLSMLIGTATSIVTLVSVLPALQQYPSLRSPPNLTCAGLSVAFVAAGLSYFVYVAYRIAVA
jgi:hypothetical protein